MRLDRVNRAAYKDNRQHAEQNASGGLPDQYAGRTEQDRPQPDQWNGSQRVTSPIEPCRIERTPQIVETGVRHKQHAIKEERQGQRSTEQKDKRQRHAIGIEQRRDVTPQEKQDHRCNHHDDRCEQQRIIKCATNAGEIPCAVVLTNDRTNRT